jgi:hypothetical protein
MQMPCFDMYGAKKKGLHPNIKYKVQSLTTKFGNSVLISIKYSPSDQQKLSKIYVIGIPSEKIFSLS